QNFFVRAYNDSFFAKTQIAEIFTIKSFDVLPNNSFSLDTRGDWFSSVVPIVSGRLAEDVYSARLPLLYGTYLSDFGQNEEEALAVLYRALSLSPNNPHIIFRIADAYAKFGNKEKAIEYADRAYQITSDFDSSKIKYAKVLFILGENRRSEQFLLDNFDTLVIDNEDLIRIYFTNRRFDILEEIFTKRLNNNPNE